MNWTRRKRAAEHGRRRLDRQRLREAGHALDQEMAARDEADEHALEHLVLAGDHPLDLDERLLELRRGGRTAPAAGGISGVDIGSSFAVASALEAA